MSNTIKIKIKSSFTDINALYTESRFSPYPTRIAAKISECSLEVGYIRDVGVCRAQSEESLG